jgi:diguanylate cyclase
MLGIYDHLNAPPRRLTLVQRPGPAPAHAEPRRRALALVYLEADGFKPIAEMHGLDISLELQGSVAATLTGLVRAEDIVSPLESGAFACLLPGSPSREYLSQLAWKLLDAVSAPSHIGKIKLALRPCIGIAIWPADGATYAGLLRNAGAAMYRARQQKSGYAFFDERADIWNVAEDHDA